MLEAEARTRLEHELHALLLAQDWRAAATATVRGYGPEILGYLFGIMGREDGVDDAFSQFCEDLWRGLPSFRRESSLRTWAYKVAQNVAYRQARREHRRRRRVAPIAEFPDLEQLADELRTATLPYLRTEVRAEVARLREQLAPDERSLIILRVDRRLSWEAIARILAEDAEPDAEALKRDAARLRKRYERIKQRIRELAKPLVADG
jgi:RNA polymerase sigma-70 factor (ECF subfamily)